MPQHYEEKILPYTHRDLFSLVADVESYPSFLPWCSKATIYEKTNKHILAKLHVGKSFATGTFTSHVILTQSSNIKINYINGPLKYLKNNWQFIPKGTQKTNVCFELDFEFKSSLFNLLIKEFFNEAFFNIMTAFENEAQKRFHKK